MKSYEAGGSQTLGHFLHSILYDKMKKAAFIQRGTTLRPRSAGHILELWGYRLTTFWLKRHICWLNGALWHFEGQNVPILHASARIWCRWKSFLWMKHFYSSICGWDARNNILILVHVSPNYLHAHTCVLVLFSFVSSYSTSSSQLLIRIFGNCGVSFRKARRTRTVSLCDQQTWPLQFGIKEKKANVRTRETDENSNKHRYD